jgi:transposase
MVRLAGILTPGHTTSCYEAGPTGFALHRQLTALGVENVMAAPTRLRRVNNDRTDTLQLAGRLDRDVAGGRRMWTRQRKQLQIQRLRVASQTRALVLMQGLGISNPWWKPLLWSRHQAALPA